MASILIRNFYEAILPHEVKPGQLMLWSKIRRSGKTQTDWCYSQRQAARLSESYRNTREVLFGVALQSRQRALARARRRYKRATPARVLGDGDSVTALPALWAEIGVARGSAGASAAALPPARSTALGLLEAVSRPPSIVVWTGTGYQVYWLLDKLWELETAEDRRRGARVLRKVQWAIAKAAAVEGWEVDHSGDLGRLMRVPETFHHRGKERLKAVIEQFRLAGEADRRWAVADFETLEDPPEPERVGRADAVAAGGETLAAPAADFGPVWEGCSWLRHCHGAQATLPERDWRAALSIVGRCVVREPGPGRSAAGVAGPVAAPAGGRSLAKSFSAGHPGHVPHLLDEELTRTLGRKSGPATCGQIARLDSAAGHCPLCPSRGRIRSPIDLGRSGSAALDSSGSVPPGSGLTATGGPGGEARQRQVIVVAGDESEVNARALAALAAGSPAVFERAGALVEVARPAGRSPGGRTPRAVPVQEPRLREILAGRCAFVSAAPDPAKGKPVRPPRWCTRAILARSHWPELPSLAGVVEGPVLRADGSLVTEPGYDPASGYFHAAAGRFEAVPERPVGGEVDAALALLRETVCDFPFAGEVHYAAWLAAVLAAVARPAFQGPSPLSFVDADRRGVGKSLLVDVASVILTGRPAPRLPFRRGEDEIQRSITELVFEGRRLALYDNVTGVFGSAALARALTAPTWGGGPVELPQEISWWVTSNGVVLDADLPRRTIRIRLESEDEHPEERTDFRHPRLLAWVGENRGRIVPAALTLLRAYVAAGRPAQRLPGLGSFEGWSDLVRSAVVFHRLPDPAEARMTRSELAAPGAGAEQEVPASFLDGLEELLAVLGGQATARQMVAALADEAHRDDFAVLRSALRQLYPELGAGLPTAQQLGYTLRSMSGKAVGGRRIVQVRKSTRGVTWSLRKTHATLLP